MTLRDDPTVVNRRLVFLGPPGAGKGTQAAQVAEAFGLSHISTGELFRQAVRRGDELGRVVKRYMEEGKLVPDEVVMELVRQSMAGLGDDPGFVLDGIPRTVRQAQGLADLLNHRGIPVQAAVFFDIDEETVLRRLSGRRECPTCGRNYNVFSNPPHTPGVCDVDGTPLVQRPDDEPSVVRRRLQVYTAQTAPVVDFYRQAHLLYRVDANLSPEEIFDALCDILRGRRKPAT
jgi:adenylate kinase